LQAAHFFANFANFALIVTLILEILYKLLDFADFANFAQNFAQQNPGDSINQYDVILKNRNINDKI